jgi:DNA-binding LacI/PurR family transcriptional regulator
VTAARRHHHDVVLLTQDEGAEGLQRIAAASLVDSIIVMDVATRDVRLPALRSLRLPAVLIGFPAEPGGLTCIGLDFEAAGRISAEHLADAGCREVALIGPPPEVYQRGTGFAQQTQSGFERAARHRGLRPVTWPCDPAPDAVRATVASLLEQRPGIDGVVVHNEPALDRLLEAFRAAGRRIGQDLSVLAMCPDELAEQATPALTCIAIPAGEVARQAVALLMAKLGGQDVPGATLLAPRLTVRASTGLPPGQKQQLTTNARLFLRNVPTAAQSASRRVADHPDTEPVSAPGGLCAGRAQRGAASARGGLSAGRAQHRASSAPGELSAGRAWPGPGRATHSG